MTFAAETMVGLRENLKDAISTLTTSDHALVTSISSGCELFLRFITLTALDNPVGASSSSSSYSHFYVGSMYVRLHVARSYTLSDDSPFWLISSLTLSNHLPLGLPSLLPPFSPLYFHFHRSPSYIIGKSSSLTTTCPYHFNLLSWTFFAISLSRFIKLN